MKLRSSVNALPPILRPSPKAVFSGHDRRRSTPYHLCHGTLPLVSRHVPLVSRLLTTCVTARTTCVTAPYHLCHGSYHLCYGSYHLCHDSLPLVSRLVPRSIAALNARPLAGNSKRSHPLSFRRITEIRCDRSIGTD